MKYISNLYISIIIILLSYSNADAQSLDSSHLLIESYFNEAKKISETDNGKIWGSKLYGPMILVDPKTNRAAANEPDSAGAFTKTGHVYFGTVPKSFAANTARKWGGKIWTVILWPLPADKLKRGQLMMHELFHQYQKNMGLPAYSPSCDHLEKMEARILLKLELEALRKVINEYPKYSKQDLVNAVAMRLHRYQKYPLADSVEHALEINEGLATYTEFVLTQPALAETKKIINDKLDNFYKNETFVRSLGYITGYLYGFLLYKANPAWNKPLFQNNPSLVNPDFYWLREIAGFDKQLLRLYKLSVPKSLAEIYNSVITQGKYNYSSIHAFEKLREDKRLTIEAENKKKFVDGPVLELPNEKMNFNFNPNEVRVLEGYGPIYPSFTAKAEWGLLEVSKGGALVKDWMFVYVPLPQNFNSLERTIITSGWKLELKEGWVIIEGKRKGDYKVVKQ